MEVFETPLLVELDPRAYHGQARWTGIGLLGNRLVVVIFTTRDEDTIRIISLRKTSKHERKKFEKEITDGLVAD